ncbi:MAG: NAD-dependent epimerase/dehydratase family protein [Armatimonadota bacterium]
MFVLVTGGAGYVGCQVVRELLRRGKRVRVFDKGLFGFQGLEEVGTRIELVRGDVRTFDPAALEDVSAVIHLAALSNDPTSELDPQATTAVNFEGAVQVAEAAKSHGIATFVFASSAAVYGFQNDWTLCSEEAPTNPQTTYAESKAQAEQALMAMADDGFQPVILRKGTVFGWSPRMRYDLAVNTFCKDARQYGRIRVFGGGENWRPNVYVGDAAVVYANALDLSPTDAEGRVFNINHKNYRISEMANWLSYVLRDHLALDVEVDYHQSPDNRSYAISAERAARVGLRCETGLAHSVQELWRHFDHDVTNDFGNPRYYNIKWLKLLMEMREALRDMGPLP